MAPHDSLAAQLQALQQAKSLAAATQASNEQEIAKKQEHLRRETFQALCASPRGGLAETLKRFASPRPMTETAAAGAPHDCLGSQPQTAAEQPTAGYVAAADPLASLGSRTRLAGPIVPALDLAMAQTQHQELQQPQHSSEAGDVSSCGDVNDTLQNNSSNPKLPALEGDAKLPLVPSFRAVPSGATTSHAPPLSSRGPPPPRASSPSKPRPATAFARHEVQAELEKCREVIHTCVQSITPQSLRELRSFQRPPTAINNVLEATAILLGAQDSQPVTVRKTLQGNLPERLREIDPEDVTVAQFRRLRRLLVLPEFDEHSLRASCPCVVPLAVWCRAIGAFLNKVRAWGPVEFEMPPPQPVPLSQQLHGCQPARSPRGHEPEKTETVGSQRVRSRSPGKKDVSPARPVSPARHRRAASPPRSKEAKAAPQSFAPPLEVIPEPEPQQLPCSKNEPTESAPVPRANRRAENAGALVVSPDLASLSQKELQEVNELMVCKPGVGSITFHGVTDCIGLDIQSLVHLDVGEVLVYPYGSKPTPGQGLNKQSTVTMYQCWPPNGRGHLVDESAQDRYRGKIKQMTEDKKATFIDYDCGTGIWKFRVEHF